MTLALLFLTVTAAITAMYSFQHMDVVRGFFDARAGQVSVMYAGIVGIMAALACLRPRVIPIAFGFLAGSQLALGVLGLVLYLHPMNHVTVFFLTLPVGAMGSVLVWKRTRTRRL